ncbi:MAG TPA: amino acid ABC transporter permease [Candidatus Scatomorpha pullistercoris]|uniref:Amino acid ABC transporter permease n=1 Tax=Candidatus Scatomorpha pullistercoris TaxID=2840929 RepID=A0A9D1K9P3_9FIRM|nr:amino acid ABC transporter permease [Candidatus Scatomorpha pullistercoris]
MNRWAPLGVLGRRKLAWQQQLQHRLDDGLPLTHGDKSPGSAARRNSLLAKAGSGAELSQSEKKQLAQLECVLSEKQTRSLLRSLGRSSRLLLGFRPISLLSRFVVWVIRGTPLMLQLLIVFYIPGYILPTNPWSFAEGRFAAAAVMFIINYACYFSEIYRGGIQGVPIGQQEAGQVLGMTKGQIFRHVTLLQMIKRIVPPMSNEIITLVKDTSLARIISYQEVIWAGYAFLKGSHGYSGLIWPLLFTGVYYLVFNGVVSFLLGRLERRLEFFR